MTHLGSRGCGWAFGMDADGASAAEYSTASARRSVLGGQVGSAASRVRSIACSRRQRATAPWSPDVRIAGTSMPRKTAGRVYCGYSSSPSRERLLGGRRVLDGAGQQPDDGVDDDERRQLAAGQHVVADRQLEVDQRADPLVDALVARADEDEMRSRRRGRRRAPGGRPRRPGRAGSRSSPSRRRASSAAATGSGRRIIPAPPPYGASSTERCRPRPHSRRSWMRIAARPCSWIRPGMLSASGPSNIAGNSVRTSISRVMRRVRRLGGLGRDERRRPRAPRRARRGRRRLGARRRAPSPAARRLRPVGVGRPRSRRPQVERLGVDDDLAAARREDPDERADGRQVERCRTARRRRCRPRSRRRGRCRVTRPELGRRRCRGPRSR